MRLLCEAGASREAAGPVIAAATGAGHIEAVRALCELGFDKDRVARHQITFLNPSVIDDRYIRRNMDKIMHRTPLTCAVTHE